MCVYATEENGKLKYVKECLASLLDTVDLIKHRLIVVNNSAYEPTVVFLNSLAHKKAVNGAVMHQYKNLGTSAGINVAIRLREPGELVIKADDDLTWGESGWVEKLEEVCTGDVGIVGLKRDDVYGEFRKEGNLWWTDDIFGTCTAYNPLMLDKVGYSCQPSLYGYDDVLMSVRSVAAGFRNCFRVDIPITNLDEGGTAYTEWKKREAGVYLKEVGIMCDMYRDGSLDVYYDGGFGE